MRNAIRFLMLGFLAAGAMGCAVADTGAFGRLSDEVGVLRRDVNALKAGPPASARAEEAQGLRRTVADLGNDSDRLRSEQLAIKSRLDETNAELKRVVNRQAELERALQENRRAAEELEKRVIAMESGKQTKADSAALGDETSGASSEKNANSSWKSPEEMYEYAVGQVKAGSPKKGREILTAFTAQHPGHKLLPNVLYWRGESYYSEQDYENAILAFQDVVDKYSDSDKAPDAIYKQGLSFLALKDKKNARILLNLITTKYPKSPAAELARKQLSQIK